MAAQSGLFRFDAEVPREIQSHWEFHVERDKEFDEPDDGVLRKAKTDWKVFLHWRPDLADLLATRGVTLSPWQKDWFEHCRRIHAACSISLLALTQKMDAIRPGFGFARRFAECSDPPVLRILKYEPREGDLARCHTDRCGITFHIAESAPGLEGREGWDWMPYRSPESPEVLCFPGKQLESITQGSIPALYHQVVDTTRGSRARWAMVFFGKLKKDPGMY
jgi:isopenicillin N synthase-like dioxygenase